MENISLSEVFDTLELQLKTDEWEKIEVYAKDFDRCVSLVIDGDVYISTLSFWPNGLCDVDSIEVASEKPEFKHFEFGSNQEASSTILNELRLLLIKSNVT